MIAHKPIYHFDGWRLDVGRRRLYQPNGDEILLTSTSFDLLTLFCSRPQTVITRDEITNAVTPHRHRVSLSRAVDVMVSRLRSRLNLVLGSEDLIVNVRHGGYYFTPPVYVVWNDA
jgi:DNA-binding response OmpR family regulator